MTLQHIAFALAGLFAATTAWLLVHGWLGQLARRRRERRRIRHAQRGEERAESLLARHGFVIEDRQVPATWSIRVAGEAHPVDLRADLLVTRDGVRYVAEVKTGRTAPRITTAATRRQLLEYQVAYLALDVDGVLLVDMEAEQITPVEFPLPGPSAATPGLRTALALLWLAAGAAIGLALAPWLTL
ncbi:MAG: hypothetical protein AAGC55_25225 [Myxococcota bacterium]